MSSSTSNTFTLLVPPHIKSVQLLGSWDNYGRRYEMTQSQSTPGMWRLNIKFPETGSFGSKRYWYYYILDGYFESHDPNMPTTTEPTRGITLNILDIIRSGSSSPVSPRSARPEVMYPGSHVHPAQYSLRSDQHIRCARPPSHPSIVAPKPRNPMAAHKLTIDTDYHRPYTTYDAGSPLTSDSHSSSSSGSEWESPVTPINDYSDGEYASDSSSDEYTHHVRPMGKYAFPSSKSKRHGHYDLAAEMGRIRIAS